MEIAFPAPSGVQAGNLMGTFVSNRNSLKPQRDWGDGLHSFPLLPWQILHTHTQSHPREYTCSSYFSTKYIILQLFKAALWFSAHEISAKEIAINVFSLRAVATNAK